MSRAVSRGLARRGEVNPLRIGIDETSYQTVRALLSPSRRRPHQQPGRRRDGGGRAAGKTGRIYFRVRWRAPGTKRQEIYCLRLRKIDPSPFFHGWHGQALLAHVLRAFGDIPMGKQVCPCHPLRETGSLETALAAAALLKPRRQPHGASQSKRTPLHPAQGHLPFSATPSKTPTQTPAGRRGNRGRLGDRGLVAVASRRAAIGRLATTCVQPRKCQDRAPRTHAAAQGANAPPARAGCRGDESRFRSGPHEPSAHASGTGQVER